MKVPFVDLRAQHETLAPELREAFERVLQKSSFILGPEVERFEREFADYLGASECVAVSSGTAALHLALLALGIGPGDEVITVPNTFIATAEAITAAGARPIFVDVDPYSGTMDSMRVEEAMTPRTRAILPVHLYGQSAALDPLLAIARAHGLALVEDACQAHGGEYRGRKLGTLGSIGCFSFYPSKNLGCCGEGGAAVTNDPDLAMRIRLLRDHGSVRKYEHLIPGLNCRMEGLQAAILSVKLKSLDSWNEKRRAIAAAYSRMLVGSGLVLPEEVPGTRHVYHLYVVQSDHRDLLRERLTDLGIGTGLHYPVPLHLQEAYRSLGYRTGDFPVSELLAKRILSLPMYPELSCDSVEHVVSALKEALEWQWAEPPAVTRSH